MQSGPYFLELIRYIHLNPVRAGIVSDIDSLGSYRYAGYGALMGRKSTVADDVNDSRAFMIDKRILGDSSFAAEARKGEYESKNIVLK